MKLVNYNTVHMANVLSYVEAKKLREESIQSIQDRILDPDDQVIFEKKIETLLVLATEVLLLLKQHTSRESKSNIQVATTQVATKESGAYG
jgi:type IV secretory pathway TraG/TraD family ATPase VirD4